MSTITCPLCEWTLEVDDQLDARNAAAAPAVAAALGMPADALFAIHAHQVARQTESRINTHMGTHTPQEWLPALMEARRGNQRREDLIAELRRHLESLERQVRRLENAGAAAS